MGCRRINGPGVSAAYATLPDMTAPQLELYAAARSGRTAIIHTETGEIVAWVERVDADLLRARRGSWGSEPVETIPQAIRLVSERLTSRTPPQVI